MVDHHPQPGVSTDGRQRNAQAPSVSASDDSGVRVVVVWLLLSGHCVLVTGSRRRYLSRRQSLVPAWTENPHVIYLSLHINSDARVSVWV